MLGGTTMMKEHSRLCGYLSGKPGDSMRPEGLVKLREQSEPGTETRERRNAFYIRQVEHVHQQPFEIVSNCDLNGKNDKCEHTVCLEKGVDASDCHHNSN